MIKNKRVIKRGYKDSLGSNNQDSKGSSGYLRSEKFSLSVNNFGQGWVVVLVLLTMFLPLVSAASYNPNALSVNGRLTDSSGNSLTGNYVMNFSIYNNLTGGDILWSSGNISVTTDSNGIYNTRLTGINLNFSKQYYLETMVETETLTPRINMTSSGWAYRALNVSVSGVEFDSNFDVNDFNLTNIERVGVGTLSERLNVIIQKGEGLYITNNGNMYY